MRTSHRGQFSTSERHGGKLCRKNDFRRYSTFVENDFITENLNFDGAVRPFDQSGQDLAHGLGACLDVHSAYPEDDGRPSMVSDC